MNIYNKCTMEERNTAKMVSKIQTNILGAPEKMGIFEEDLWKMVCFYQKVPCTLIRVALKRGSNKKRSKRNAFMNPKQAREYS